MHKQVLPKHRLRELREAAKLPRLTVATKLGVDPSTVVRWEAADELPREQIIPLAELLKVTPAYLTGWADEPRQAA